MGNEIIPKPLICSSFPQLSPNLICRDNFLDAIEMHFSEDCSVVSVDGQPGMGKTTLLANYALMKASYWIGIFARPTSKITFDPQILFYDLCNQLSYQLKGKELSHDQIVEEGDYRNMLFHLQRRAMRQRQYIYFIVDGLDEIPKEAVYARDFLLGLLPLGNRSLRFILTNLDAYVTDTIKRTCNYKAYTVAPFSIQDSIQFLHCFALEQSHVQEIHRACKGYPGNLASVRRLLENTSNTTNIIADIPNTLTGLYEKEWCAVDSNDSSKILLLACIAHIRTNHTTKELSAVCSLTSDEVVEALCGLPFVTIDGGTNEVEYVSETFRQFAAKKLATLKSEVDNKVVDLLIKNPNSHASLSNLPTFLKEANRPQDILTYLSPENFEKIIDIQKSYIPIQQQADIGIDAALKLNQDGDLVKLCTYRSSVIEFCQSSVWQSQVDCKIALGDYEGALQLAQHDCMKEDRLQLLAAIARAERTNGKVVEQAVLDEIRSLFSQIDTEELGDRTIEIACDLLYTLPELAIELVEKRTELDTNENAIDLAFVKFSVEAALARKGQEEASSNPLNAISSKIRDPKIRRFTEAAGVLFGDYSASQVISEVEKLTGTSNRLFLLRQWAQTNYERADALEVIEYALSATIRATEYAPNARVFREMVAPLPYLTSSSRVDAIIRSIDSQKGNLERLGPTEEYIWVQLLLAQTEAKHDINTSIERLINVYLEISDLEDLSLKADCLANFIAFLKHIDPEQKTNEKEELWNLAVADFDDVVDKILSMTGEHYYTMRRVVSHLSRADVQYAARVAEKFNIEFRRDKAFLDIVKAATSIPISEWQFDGIAVVLDNISDIDIKDESIIHIIEHIAVLKQNNEKVAKYLAGLRSETYTIGHSPNACRCLCLLYNILSEFQTSLVDIDLDEILVNLKKRWEGIDITWVRIDVGFRISALLAQSNSSFAIEMSQTTEELRNQTPLNTEPSALTYICCTKLAIRALAGLFPGNRDTGDDILDIARIIDKLPSYGERAKLWAELSLRFWLSNRKGEFSEIVKKRLKPAFDNIPITERYYRSVILRQIAPAFYLDNSASALDMLRTLSRQDRDSSLTEAASFIIYQTVPSDPYDAPCGSDYKLRFSDIEYLLSILRIIETDSDAYSIIKSITNSIAKERNPYISMQQKEEIAQQLEEIAKMKFPHPSFIKHDGYNIAACAQIALLRKQSPRVWLELSERARSIPNTADSALVLGMIASIMKSKFAVPRQALIGDAKALIRSIPALYDRIEHLENLSEQLVGIDNQERKRVIREAMEITFSYDRDEISKIQRRLIDASYRFDPDFASSLASLADDDPSKARQTHQLRNRLDIQKTKTMIGENKISNLNSHKEMNDLSHSSWLYLAALNAGRVPLLGFNEQTRNMVQIASRSPMSMAYPIFACLVENLSKKYSNTNVAVRLLRPIFSSFLLCARLSERIACKRLRLTKNIGQGVELAADISTVIGPGERDNALLAITEKIAKIIDGKVTIADPYFGPNELRILQTIRNLSTNTSICILTSRKFLELERIQQPWSDTFIHSWHLISDALPPVTHIIVAAVEPDNTSPIHDRWIVTEKGGIRLGTSLNTLGITKISEASLLSKSEALARYEEIAKFTMYHERVFNGKRIRYIEFDL